MGLTDLFADFYSALSFSTEAYAEAPAEEEKEEDSGEGESEEKSEGESEEAEEEAPEEEEEEEEEPEDLKPKLEEECMHSSACQDYKHHFDECAERVATQMEENDGKAKEDCIEEFFHLAHCATNCAAPKLFKALK